MIKSEVVREAGYFELEAQLKKWWKLLNTFRSLNENELEFDLKHGGITSIEYVNTLNLLKILTKQSGTQIESAESAKLGENIKNSIAIISQINRHLEKLLFLRQELKDIGTKKLYRMCRIPVGS